MKRLVFYLVLASAVSGMFQEAGAIGRVYARWPNSASSPIYNLRIKTLHANVTIQDQLAVTRVDQEFANDNSMRLEGFYVFQLPEGAEVHELYLWINGVKVPYQVKKKQDAIVQYEQIVRGMADPAVLQQLGANRFQLRIFPIDAMSTRRIEIAYSQPLTFYKGSIQYVFPMDMHDYTSAPIEQASVSIAISSQLPITGVTTSVDQYPAAVVVTKHDSLHYGIAYGVENVSFAKDFKVQCSLDRHGETMLAICYRGASFPAEPGAFMLWSIVPDTLSGDSARPRELTFAADISSSMEGERIAQLKEGLNAFIDLLTERDRFNIVAFSTGIVKFMPDLVPVTGASKADAKAFVAQLAALGMTNIEEAFHQSLQQSYTDSVHGALIFMTDGQATWGEMRTDSLVARARRWNTANIPVFPLALGQEPNITLMRTIAEQTGGSLMQVMADDSLYLKVRDFYRMIFLPKFRNASMAIDGLGLTELFPSPLPEVYTGDQMLLTGRYTVEGTKTPVLSGTVLGTPVSISEPVAFVQADSALFEIERYWGSQKIQRTLNVISQLGEQQELIDQIVALSIKYSVLTPYTAFLVVEPTGPQVASVNSPSNHPLTFGLEQNFPNPFNPSTTIRYSLAGPQPAYVVLTVHDVLGRLVRTLLAERQPAGEYSVVWDGSDDLGRKVASGVYICRLTAGTFTAARTMILLK